MLRCFLLGLNFMFPFSIGGMVMYDNELDTKENKCKPRLKLNHNTDIIPGRFAPARVHSGSL